MEIHVNSGRRFQALMDPSRRAELNAQLNIKQFEQFEQFDMNAD